MQDEAYNIKVLECHLCSFILQCIYNSIIDNTQIIQTLITEISERQTIGADVISVYRNGEKIKASNNLIKRN
jgi:hypothetical protein